MKVDIEFQVIRGEDRDLRSYLSKERENKSHWEVLHHGETGNTIFPMENLWRHVLQKVCPEEVSDFSLPGAIVAILLHPVDSE